MTNFKIIRLREGDIFRVPIKGMGDRYFQYIGDDSTQLNSNIIRVFKETFPIQKSLNLSEISNSEIDFHAHVFIKLGISVVQLWDKVGNVEVKKLDEVIYRSSSDYGNPEIIASKKWWIWRANESEVFVGNRSEYLSKSEIGVVYNPHFLVNRIITGSLNFFYPAIDWD